MIAIDVVLGASTVSSVDCVATMEAGAIGSMTAFAGRKHAWEKRLFLESDEKQGGEGVIGMEATAHTRV